MLHNVKEIVTLANRSRLGGAASDKMANNPFRLPPKLTAAMK